VMDILFSNLQEYFPDWKRRFWGGLVLTFPLNIILIILIMGVIPSVSNFDLNFPSLPLFIVLVIIFILVFSLSGFVSVLVGNRMMKKNKKG